MKQNDSNRPPAAVKPRFISAISAAAMSAVALLAAAPAANSQTLEAEDLKALEVAVPFDLPSETDTLVMVDVWPTQEAEGKFTPDEQLPAHRIIPEFSISQNTVWVYLEPTEFPANYMDTAGFADINVQVMTAGSDPQLADTGTTIRFASAGSWEGWVDPADTPPELGEVATLSNEQKQPATVDMKQVKVTEDLDELLSDEAKFASLKSDVTVQEGGGVCPITKPRHLLTRNRWAATGETFTLKTSDSTAQMIYNSGREHSTTFGAAVSYGGGEYSASETRTRRDTWGQTFNYVNTYRQYRINVEFRKYRVYVACGSIRKDTWMAHHETGGTRTLELGSHPQYRHCQAVSNGTWTREYSGYRAYEHSGGFKVKDILGFNMKVISYFSSGKIYNYNVTGGNKAMCGKETDPAFAGRLALNYQ